MLLFLLLMLLVTFKFNNFIYGSAAPGGLKDSKCFSRPERDEEAVKKRKQEKKKISAEAKARDESYKS